MNALDLFCSAGGVTRGLQLAGFHVTGVDLKPQPRYVGDAFIQADALNPPMRLTNFDLICASPPCQAHTSLKNMWNALPHDDLIPATRALLQASGRPYIIENVPGSPLHGAVTLCGTMFGLGCPGAELRRHRLFEASFPVLAPSCQHGIQPRVIGVYGGHGRDRRRLKNTQDFPIAARRHAMGIDWMTGAELSQAIPPAYAHWLAVQFLNLKQRSEDI